MPRPRRPNNQNKSLPKFLQSGVFEHWGRKVNELFPNKLTSPSPTHLTVGDSSQSEADSIKFIAYPLPCADYTSQDSLDELPPSDPHADNNQPSYSSNSYHSSRQRPKRVVQNPSRSTANDLPRRQSRQSPRRRETRRQRHRARGPADDSEASRLSPSNASSLSSARLPTSLQSGIYIESTDRDRYTSAASGQESPDHFSQPRLSNRASNHQMPASFSRSQQRLVSLEPSPILPPAGTTGSSQTITPFPIRHPASNTGTQNGTFLPRMDPFSPGDVARANPAAGYYSISEPPISSSQTLNDVCTSTYSTCPSTYMYLAHASSSSLSSMAQPGYYNQSFSRSLNEDIVNDSAVGGSFYSYYPSSDSCLPPYQPASSVNPQIYSGMNTPGGTHSTYSASSRSLSHVGSPGLQTTSSSSQPLQTTQGYVSTFGVNANVQDPLFLPETNYRSLPRSYDFQAQSHGLSQEGVYGRSQRPRDIVPGFSPTYASKGHNHPPNAIETSSVSSLDQDTGY